MLLWMVNLCAYNGDPAYPLRVHLQAPYRRENLTPEMAAFNKSMNTARVSVEWIFGDICNYFKFIDFKKNLKIGLSSVGKLYMVSALFRNALTKMAAEETRRRAMETLSETKKRNESEDNGRKRKVRKGGNAALEFLKEKGEKEQVLKEECNRLERERIDMERERMEKDKKKQ